MILLLSSCYPCRPAPPAPPAFSAPPTFLLLLLHLIQILLLQLLLFLLPLLLCSPCSCAPSVAAPPPPPPPAPVQAFFLVGDDIMDGSETRRGQPCWYRRQDIGMAAFNDSILLETAVYSVLKEHFGRQPGYLQLLELLLHSSKVTALGQALDLSSASEYSRVRGGAGSLDSFTMARYSCIVKYKTSHYSFVLPVHLAMRLAGVARQEVLDTAEEILLDIGHYFQACDDFLDCYGDPEVTGKVGTDIQDGKCSWLMATALERCSSGQRRRLEEHYGSSESAEVAEVLEVYRELGLQQVFRDYEERFFAEASQRIEKVEGLPTEVFSLFLDRVYKRTS